MRSKQQPPISFKPVIFVAFFFIFLLLLKLGPNFSSNINNLRTKSLSSNTHRTFAFQTAKPSQSLKKIPPSLANALVHYASTNITPQQTYQELQLTLKVLEKKSPCNFLVFGLGNDSLMWSMLNYGGRTVFLEENEKWIGEVKRFMPFVEAYYVNYKGFQLAQAVELLPAPGKGRECREVNDPRFTKCPLAIKTFPDEVYNTEWDVIMVDAPTGYRPDLPGRMTAIYTAGLMARNRKDGETDIFVHDIDRWVENRFSMAYLCPAYWKKEIGRIRHFTIPSHRVWLNRPYCP